MGDNRKIGIIDSGIGGLTVFKELKKVLPNESVIYFGDNKNVPYGNKSEDEIYKLTKHMIDFLVEKDVKLIAVACNTISSILKYFKDYGVPIVGIIEPTAQYVIKNNIDKVGVIATNFTIKSGTYERLIKQGNNDIKVVSEPCPSLAMLIDSLNYTDDEISNLVNLHMSNLLINDNEIKNVILGCTHYPIVFDTFIKNYPDINFINPAYEQVIKIQNILKKNNMIAYEKDATSDIYTTGDTVIYEKMFIFLSINKSNSIQNLA